MKISFNSGSIDKRHTKLECDYKGYKRVNIFLKCIRYFVKKLQYL